MTVFSPRFTARVILALFLFQLLFCGCALQTKSAIYYVGPILYRVGGANSNICQIVSLPLGVQVGRQCELAIGCSSKTVTLNQPAETKPWRLRFWQVLPVADTPVFSFNRHFGLRAQAGSIQDGLFAGYATSFVVQPNTDGLYHISFDSNKPMAAEFQFWREAPAGFAAIFSTPKQKP